jgi:hypothetical protein
MWKWSRIRGNLAWRSSASSLDVAMWPVMAGCHHGLWGEVRTDSRSLGRVREEGEWKMDWRAVRWDLVSRVRARRARGAIGCSCGSVSKRIAENVTLRSRRVIVDSVFVS